MSREASLDGRVSPNIYDEHSYRIRVLFGASVVTSYLGKDVTFARNSAGNYTVTLPKPYTEITDFDVQFMQATGAILQATIKTSTVTVDGKFIVEVRNSSGTATDPAAADRAFITVGVSTNLLNSKFGG